MEDKTYCVYKHTSPSGKAYIGLTKNYNNRCRQHRWNRSGCSLFLKAIKKHGWDNFTHEILLQGVTRADALKYEESALVTPLCQMGIT